MLTSIILLMVVSSCRKDEEDILWQKSFVAGTGSYLMATPDSGIISCGESGGAPYLIKIDKTKQTVFEYESERSGRFSSAWSHGKVSMAAGSAGRNMLLARIDEYGNKVWDTVFTTSYAVDRSSLCYLGNGDFLAVGSADPDSASASSSGLLCVWFDTTGTVSDFREIVEPGFLAANEAVTDANGNIFLAATRLATGYKTKASVVKYSPLLQKIWEEELYNNPNFGAASLSLRLDNTGSIYVTGKTELEVSTGIQDNTFVALVGPSGTTTWKDYLEYANEGSFVITDDPGQPIVLNRNCLIINSINKEDGSVSEIIRTFKECDSQNTDAYGYCMDFDYQGNLVIAGSKGGRFYMVMKSPLSVSPV